MFQTRKRRLWALTTQREAGEASLPEACQKPQESHHLCTHPPPPPSPKPGRGPCRLLESHTHTRVMNDPLVDTVWSCFHVSDGDTNLTAGLDPCPGLIIWHPAIWHRAQLVQVMTGSRHSSPLAPDIAAVSWGKGRREDPTEKSLREEMLRNAGTSFSSPASSYLCARNAGALIRTTLRDAGE